MHFTLLIASILTIVFIPQTASAQTVPAKCTLAKYDKRTVWDVSLSSKAVERFNCTFSQSGGNVHVNSKNWAFSFLAKEQGTSYIRINTVDDITFTRTGQYSLRVKY